MRMSTSIGRLLVVVASCGVAFGALREANDVLATGLFALAMVALGLAGLGAAIGRGPGYLGFALAGGVYSTLAFAPWFSGQVRPSLPTTWAIDRLPFETTYGIGVLKCPDDDTIVPGSGRLSYVVNTGFQRWNSSTFAIMPAETSVFGLPAMTDRQWVGHSLSALIVALVGALAGRTFVPPSRSA